jgi:hypothetical protein
LLKTIGGWPYRKKVHYCSNFLDCIKKPPSLETVPFNYLKTGASLCGGGLGQVYKENIFENHWWPYRKKYLTD